jgi:hypothetical protein
MNWLMKLLRAFKETSNSPSYYRGRKDGWFACENLCLKRMREQGYTQKQIQDILA